MTGSPGWKTPLEECDDCCWSYQQVVASVQWYPYYQDTYTLNEWYAYTEKSNGGAYDQMFFKIAIECGDSGENLAETLLVKIRATQRDVVLYDFLKRLDQRLMALEKLRNE